MRERRQDSHEERGRVQRDRHRGQRRRERSLRFSAGGPTIWRAQLQERNRREDKDCKTPNDRPEETHEMYSLRELQNHRTTAVVLLRNVGCCFLVFEGQAGIALSRDTQMTCAVQVQLCTVLVKSDGEPAIEAHVEDIATGRCEVQTITEKPQSIKRLKRRGGASHPVQV